MSFHRVLTGTNMKCSDVSVCKNVKSCIFTEETIDKNAPESHGEISKKSDHERDAVEYKQYFNAYARLSHIIHKASGCMIPEMNDADGFGGICVDRDNDVIYAEYCDASALEYSKSKDFSTTDKTLLKINISEFNVSANTVNAKTGEVGRYTPVLNKPKAGERCGSAALFAYMVWLRFATPKSKTEQTLQRELMRCLADAIPVSEHKFMQDLQTCIRYQEDIDDIKFNMSRFETIQPMMQSFVEKGKIDFDVDSIKESFGDFKGFEIAWGLASAEGGSVENSHSLKELIGKFDFDPSRERTAEEKRILNDMRNTLDPEMYVSDTLIDIATDIKMSTKMKFKFRDYMLKGPTGTGKTTMCKVLGLLLNLPVVTFSCDPDTDQLALGCSVIPNAKTDDAPKIDIQSFLSTMPSIDDIMLDPEMSFKVITGKEKSDATSEDCTIEIMNKWSEITSKQENGFRYVYSNIAKAMKYGWIVEVQEPTVIQRPGVLTALNALTDDCGKLDLANGETIYRHPDAIMIYTTNLNLEGCFEMNQSQKSRFSQRTVDLPSEEELVSRLMQSTGYSNKEIAEKMVKVYTLADNYAKSKAISDGAIDFRALQAWATANMIRSNKVYENGVTEFIEKCTDDPSQKAIFITSCLENQFTPSKMKSSGMKDLRRF
jgi:hypothetical protein